ncbi:hypothetical protein LJR290_006269 [Variovorax sp. LjRoot290]|uniref:UGSC family (seleno)protein n=1 Tax=Variovorax sp. LjRoot290 TaxID=3342316 RepID=UPI003ECF7523
MEQVVVDRSMNYEVLSPAGEPNHRTVAAPQTRLSDLNGKVVFCISQVIGGADSFMKWMAEYLPAVAPGVTAVFVRRQSTYMSDEPELWARVESEADAVIYGCGACGSCSMWGTHWSVELERRGIPCVYVVDEPFRSDVELTCAKEGMPALRRVHVPHPCDMIDEPVMRKIASELVAGLTRPLSPSEIAAGSRTEHRAGRIAFRGTLDDVNRFFTRRDWTDGLPIIPPTEAAVSRMLKGTSKSPEEIVVERFHPEGYRVTVEKVAVVGAMANCSPQQMPVLLSIVEAVSAPAFASCVRSTTSFSLATLVGGPIAAKLGMNVGANALGAGTGNAVNACMGRFLRLALICLGGSKTGVSDLSSIGNPTKYSLAFSENVKESPWPSWHESHGYSADEDVVTVMYGGWNFLSPFARFMSDVKLGLDSMARGLAQFEMPRGALLLLDPIVADKLANAGYTKDEVSDYLWRRATRTARDFRSDYFYTAFMEQGIKGQGASYQTKRWPESYLTAPDDLEIQVYPKDSIKIVVVGGRTNPMSQAWQFYNPSSVCIDKWK